MTPVKIDSNASSAATDAAVGLKFTPSQTTTVNELFNGFLQRAADSANNAAAAPASSSAASNSSGSSASSSSAANGAASGDSGTPGPTKKSDATSASTRGYLPPTSLPLGARNAKQSAAASSAPPTGVFTGGKASRPSSTTTSTPAQSSAKASSAGPTGATTKEITDNNGAVTPATQTPPVVVPVVATPAAATQTAPANVATTTKPNLRESATKSQSTASVTQQFGAQAATNLNATVEAKTPPAVDTASAGTATPAVAAAQQAAATQVTPRIGQQGAVDGVVTRAGQAATSAATGKPSSIVSSRAEPIVDTAVVTNSSAVLPAADGTQISATNANANADASVADIDVARAVETALATVAATAAIATPAVEKGSAGATLAEATVAGAANATSSAAVAGSPTPQAIDAGTNSSTSESATTSGAATTAVGSGAPNKTAPSGADNSGGVDRVRFVQRVAKAFQTLGDQGGTLRLRLSPPELGTVQLNVSVHKGTMSAQVETDTTEARDLIVNNLPALRQRLNELNIQVEHFDVNLAGQSSGGTSGQSSQDNAYQQSNAWSGNAVGRSSDNDSGAVAAPASSRATLGGSSLLNVVV